jgi:hypothetical protein
VLNALERFSGLVDTGADDLGLQLKDLRLYAIGRRYSNNASLHGE